MRTTRRSFCSNTALALLSPRLLRAQTKAQQRQAETQAQNQAQPRALPGAASAHADVAAIDHDRILTAAQQYLTQPPAPLTAFPAPNSPGTPHDFYSEDHEEKPPIVTAPNAPAPPP